MARVPGANPGKDAQAAQDPPGRHLARSGHPGTGRQEDPTPEKALREMKPPGRAQARMTGTKDFWTLDQQKELRLDSGPKQSKIDLDLLEWFATDPLVLTVGSEQGPVADGEFEYFQRSGQRVYQPEMGNPE